MRHETAARRILLTLLLAAMPSLGEAGPPLICHPFQTDAGELLPWGTGPGWNTPDPGYDTARLERDLLRLLTPEAPVLTRMENIRRAVIYATGAPEAAGGLIAAVLARTKAAGDERATAAALFDAGYLIETYRQASHLHRRPVPAIDGYALVLRALRMSGGGAEMEFAAALMTGGATSETHLRRARGAATPLLARNIVEQGR